MVAILKCQFLFDWNDSKYDRSFVHWCEARKFLELIFTVGVSPMSSLEQIEWSAQVGSDVQRLVRVKE